MHAEYDEKGPGGAGWHIHEEDGAVLEGGPYPSEEATWEEIARREGSERPPPGPQGARPTRR